MAEEAIFAQEAVQGPATKAEDTGSKDISIQVNQEAQAITARKESKRRLARGEHIQVPAKEEAVITKNLGDKHY